MLIPDAMRARRAAVTIGIGAAALGVLAWGLTLMKTTGEQLSCEGWNTRPFFMAATGADVVRCLEDGATIEAQDEGGRTPLRWAAQGSSLDVVRALLAAGADVAEAGWTPLHVAVVLGQPPAAVKTLLAAGADIEAKDEAGWTPLHWAAQGDSPAVVKALLAGGADVEAFQGTFVDPYHLGWRGGGPRGKTPLHVAAGSDSPAVVKALLAAGANIEAQTTFGSTPLHVAAWGDSPAVVKVLLAAGANTEARDGYYPTETGWTPLHVAAEGDAPAVVKALLDGGADLEARGNRQPVAHGDGMPRPSPEEEKALRGSEWTPLHMAARFSQSPAVVKTLLGAGANPEARDASGRTPLDLAEKYNEAPAVVKRLRSSNARALQ